MELAFFIATAHWTITHQAVHLITDSSEPISMHVKFSFLTPRASLYTYLTEVHMPFCHLFHQIEEIWSSSQYILDFTTQNSSSFANLATSMLVFHSFMNRLRLQK